MSILRDCPARSHCSEESWLSRAAVALEARHLLLTLGSRKTDRAFSERNVAKKFVFTGDDSLHLPMVVQPGAYRTHSQFDRSSMDGARTR